MEDCITIDYCTFYMKKEEKDLLQTCIAAATMLEVPVVLTGYTSGNTTDAQVSINFRIMREIGNYTSMGPLLTLHCDVRKGDVLYGNILDVKKLKLHGTSLREHKKILKLLQAKIHEEVLRSGKE